MNASVILGLVPRLIDGAANTALITLMTAPIAFVIAVACGLCRLSAVRAVRVLATLYVEVFRGTSLLVQLFCLFYVLPLLGVELSAWTTGVGALALNFGAYGSEIVRGALKSVARGQIEAAVALHMTPAVAMRRIILPQAFAAMLPPFGNLLIELLKATSLLSLITITDLAFAGNALAQTTGDFVTIYVLLLLIYFGLAMALTAGTKILERRYGVGRLLGRPA